MIHIKLLKYLSITLAILTIINIVLIFIPDEPQKVLKIESIKLGDKNTKVVIDDQTGCRYIVFNNKTLTPLYDKKGQVYGCGQTD